MSSSKHELVEVLCSFSFDPIANPWDSTFFGEFYENIKELGFTEKQEQKGIQFKVEFNPITPESSKATSDELETRMLFRNSKSNSAIILAPHFVSFHKLAPYLNWEAFRDNEIIPGFRRYNKVGLGIKGLIQTQMLYLNKYDFEKGTALSDKFKFLPSIEKFGIGKEKSLQFQSKYEFEPNLLMQIRLNASIVNEDKKTVTLECSCLANNLDGKTDYLTLAELAHTKNNEVFNVITH